MSSPGKRKIGPEVPPLTTTISKILQRYPGGQILKELIQNADDAEATEIKFLIDDRQHSIDDLPSHLQGLDKFQGPALLSWNDAVFSDDDWKSISKIYQSTKEEKPLKVGRFGLGFISVYHITDLPCIISGDTFAVLDPHKDNINCKDDNGVPLTGTAMSVADLCNSSSLLSCYNGLFGFQKLPLNNYYKGTIFRFPLRTPQANSKLSETVYSCEKIIQDLFQSLRKEAEILLLFLKNLTKISLYKYNQRDQSSKLLLDISLNDGRIQLERDKCSELAQNWNEKENRLNSTIRLHSLSVSVRDEFEGTVRMDKCTYLVLNSIGTSDADLRSQAEQLKVIPWVGIAAPCSFSTAVENCEMSVSGSEIEMERLIYEPRTVDWQYIDPVVSGHTFCFLPLPNPTGLPVSINGYFSIADNRRSIKWPMHDEHGKGADFNRELVMKMVSYAYAVMITCRCQLVSYVNTPSYLSTKLSDAYGIWPLMSQVKNHPIWSCLVDAVVKLLINQEVVWTAAGGGKWVKFSDAYYQPEDLNIPDAVIDLLLEREIPFVVLPTVILESLNTVDDVAALIKAQKVTPVLVRQIMKEMESIPSSLLDVTKCGKIFCYILSDFTESFDGNCLVGINVIPLMNKEVKPKKISNKNKAEMLYLIPKEKENCLSFLTSIEDRIISTSLPNEIFHKLVRLTNKFNFNICFVDEIIICQQLLPLALEKWQPTLSPEFSWNPGVNNHPPLTWIFSLWKWLANNVDLNLVKDYAIVPQKCLYYSYEQEIIDKPLRLLSMSKCYSLCLTRDNDASEVEKRVADLLETLGLTIIIKSPGVFQNSGVYDNMHRLTPKTVIKLLPLNKQVISTRNALQWTTDDKKVFLKFLSKVNGTISLTADEISLIKELPLFRKGIKKLEEEYEALSTCNFFIQQQQFDDDTVAYPVDNVLYCTVEEAKFLIALNCTELSFYDYCIHHFIPFSQKQSPSQQRKNYLWLLSSESLWCNCDKLTAYLSNFPFIATAQTQKVVRPNELYDPEDPAVLRLFDDCEDGLPSHEFRKFVPQLRRLGLMTWEKITVNDEIYEKVLLNRAHSVPSILDTVGKQYALKRSLEVVTYLIQYLSSHDITQEIRHVKFLFCSCKPMLGYPCELKWAGQERSNEVFSPSELYPCESDLLIGGVGKVLSDEYSSFANCEKFQHLLKPLDMENIINQLNLLTAISKPQAAFSICVHAIYKCFSSNLVEFEKHHHKLSPNWVWIERPKKCFEDVSKFALNPFCGLRLEPFCYAVTQLPELLKYEKLFSICNIPKEFPENTMIKVMSQIQECEERLTEDFLNVVLSILDWVHKANRESGKAPDNILIPTEDYQLLSAKECIFDDRGWSQDLDHQQKHKKSIGDYSFTHQRLPLVTATFFGVKLLSKHLLPSINLKLQCIGPHQSITGRIKEALEDYDQDIDVFKELIQNAEDAGASEIKFVIDWRNHPTEYLLTTEMAAWQGPALLVYNDAVFSDEDFINICEIAGASKKIDPTKIGRFGVGFCSVYHITDVPSFVSRNFYTVFDPNLLYLGERIDPANPGVQIDFINNKKENLEEFRDQFSPFSNLFDCKILQGDGFNATLFRFPFRTEQTASKSKICNESYGDERVNNIVKKFFDEAKKMLTFLSNLKTVSLSEIKQDDCINCLMHVEKQYESLETVSLVKSFNSSPQGSVNPKQRRFVIKSSNSEQEDHWVVTSCIGDGKSLEIARSSEGKQKGLCPLGEIAVKFDQRFLSPCKSEGSLFCFIPVPIKSKFNFLINGYFDISRDRRSLKKDDKGNLTEWNTALIQDAIAGCFLEMLAKLTEASQDNTTDEYRMAYYSLWPYDHDKEGSNYNVILYSSIRRLLQVTDFKLLWSDGKWICPKIAKVYSNGPPLLPNECKKEIFSLLLKYHYPMVDIPNHVRAILSLSSINYRMFCEDILFTHLEEIDAETRDKQIVQLLKCSSGKKDWEINLLMKNKCISTRPKGILKMPKDLIDPTSDVADLYSNEDECFPAENFCEQTVLDALKSCGMVYNNLSIEQLKERASTVSSLPIDKAYDRSLKLVKYIALYCYNMSVAEELADIQFLPILKCPNMTSVPWFKYETQFAAPCKVYSSKCQTLIFSQVPLYDPGEYISMLRILKLDNKTPLMTQVVAHMTCLINHWHNNGMNYNDLTNKLIGESCRDVYAFLQNNCLKENNEELKVLLKEQLDGMSFVWHNNQFLSKENVVLEWRDATYLNYLCELSQDVQIKEFQFLFQHLGINKSPTLSQCKSVLKRLHDDQNSNPLPAQGIKLCCGIANYIASELLKDSKGNNTLQQLYLPDTSNIMRDIKHLAYKESGVENSSLGNSELLKSHFTGGTHWLHKNFSGHVARKLGIPSALDSILHKISDDSFFDDSAYGQQEDLCDRINSLLDKYPSDSSIFKEFIQNAEDAEASEIVFILDHRELHAKDGELFSKSEKWSRLHKCPSLLIYNNKTMTEKDLIGITKLGRGSKQDSLESIGRFGVGFNVAYHITDCPMFVSYGPGGVPENFCVLDPTCQYAPRATKRAPGQRWKLKDQKQYVEQFHKQLSLFLDTKLFQKFQSFSDKCMTGLEECSNGCVVFRLPLTKSGNLSSKLLPASTMSADKLKSLLEGLSIDAHVMPLFIQNLKCISAFEISKDGECSHFFTTTVHIDRRSTKNKEIFSDKIKKSLGTGSADIVSFNAIYQKTIEVTVVHEHMNKTKTEDEWLIAEQFGSTEMPQEILKAGILAGLTPLGGVAIQVNHSRNLKDCKIFCSLPLPLKSYLPLHVNGHFWVDDSRKHLETGANNSPLSKWNECLTTTVISSAYLAAIEEYREYIDFRKSEDTKRYYSIFPRNSFNKDSNLHSFGLTQCVYASVINTKKPLLQKKQISVYANKEPLEWISMNEAHFLSDMYKPSTDEGSDKLSDALLMFQLDLTNAPLEMYELVKTSNLNCPNLITPMYLLNFLKSIENIKQFENLIIDNIQLLLTYCLQVKNEYDKIKKTTEAHDVVDDNDDDDCDKQRKRKEKDIYEITNLLTGVPLLLTTDGRLKNFDHKCPVYHYCYAEYFPHRKEDFVDHRLEECEMSLLEECKFLLHVDVEYLAKHTLVPDSDKPIISSNEMDLDIHNFWKCLSAIQSRNPLLSLSLLNCKPIILGNDNYLYPLSKAKMVVCRVCDNPACNVLIKLGYPTLDTVNEVAKSCISLFVSLVASPQKGDDILQCIRLHQKSFEGFDTGCFSEFDKDLCRFLNTLSGTSLDSDIAIDYVSKLPVYKTFNGKYEALRLSVPKQCVLLPYEYEKIPTSGFHKIVCELGKQILIPENAYVEIYKCLGLKPHSMSEIYINFIFKHITYMDESDIVEHMEFLRIECCITKGSPLSLSLQKVPFMEGKIASEYFDPVVEVFSTFLSEDFFPPSPWNSKTWLPILRIIGLQSVVTGEKLIEFARQAERMEDTEKVRPLLKAIAKKIFDCCEDDIFPTFCAELVSINFIPTFIGKELQRLLTLFTKQDTDKYFKQIFVSFRNAILPKHEGVDYYSLSFTSPSNSVIDWLVGDLPYGRYHQNFIIKKLQIRVQPCSSTVVNNLSVLSELVVSSAQSDFNQRSHYVDQLEKLFMHHYYFLENCGHVVDIQLLKKRRFIFIKKESEATFLMVSSSKVVRFIPGQQDYSPYLFKVPKYFSQYVKLIDSLDISDQPMSSHFAVLLKEIYCEFHNSNLFLKSSPACLPQAENAYYELIRLLRDNNASSDQQKYYLLGEDNELYHQDELVYNDTPWYSERIKEGSGFACNFIKQPLPDMKGKHTLPGCLKVPLLSSLLTEEIKKSVCTEENECYFERLAKQEKTGDHGCEFIKTLNFIIKSKQFKIGLKRIIYHETKDVPTQTDEAVINTLDNLQFKCYRNIATVLRSIKTSEVISGSEKDVLCAIYNDTNTSHNQEGGVEMFVACHSSKPDEVVNAISQKLNSCLNNMVKNGLHIVEMIKSCSLDDIERKLDQLHVQPYHEGICSSKLVVGNVLRNTPNPSDQVVFVNFSPEEMVIFWNPEGDSILAKVKSVDLAKVNIKSLTVVTDDDDNAIDTTIWCISKLLNPSQVQNLNLHGDSTQPVTTGDLLLYRIPHESEDEAISWIHDIIKYCDNVSHQQKCFILKRLKSYTHYYLMICNNAKPIYQAILSILNKAIADIDKGSQNESTSVYSPRQEFTQQTSCGFHFSNAFSMPQRVSYHRSHGTTGVYSTSSGLVQLNAPHIHTAPWDPPAEIETRPQINLQEAQIWYCQASTDFQTCEHLIYTKSLNNPSNFTCQHPALLCFLSRQVVEKCLKALCLATCGPNKDIQDAENIVLLYNYLSNCLNDKSLEECVHQVSEYDRSTQYPDAHVPSQPPCCVYDEIDAYNAFIAAEKVIKYVKDKLNDDQGVGAAPLAWSTTLRKDFSDSWSTQLEDFRIPLLKTDSSEFGVIAEKFFKTMPNAKIVSIERIQNCELWRKFSDRAKQIRDESQNCKEKLLFHGTSRTDPKEIYTGDSSFDTRCSRKGMWGNGNYFAVNASYANSYAYPVSDTNMRKLLVAFVLTGLSYNCSPDSSLTMPPHRSEQNDRTSIRRRYHTVNGVTGGTTVYITYDNTLAYPAYVITYKNH